MDYLWAEHDPLVDQKKQTNHQTIMSSKYRLGENLSPLGMKTKNGIDLDIGAVNTSILPGDVIRQKYQKEEQKK